MIARLRQSLLRFAAVFRREQLDRDLDAEMAAHLELAIKENVQNGMSPSEARRQTLIQFGGTQQTKENHRDARGLPALEALLQDLRFGLRMLRKFPSFTAIAIPALALGIGFSTIIFSIFYNGVLYPFPYRDAQRLTGILLGLLASFLSVRLLQSQLWGISAFDPWSFVPAPVTLLTAALVACYLPARRATRFDPLVALRYE